MPLVRSSYDAGEDVLGVGAVARAIAAADRAGDDGGADGVFGTPVGRVDRRVPEEGEHGGECGVEMRGETLGVVERRGRVDEATEAGEQSAADRRQTVVGQAAVVAAVAQRAAGLEDGCHLTGPATVRMVVSKVLTAPEQVGQAGLVQRVVEATIRRPPVAHEHAVEVGVENGDGVVEPASGADGVDGRVRGGERPQPVADGADAPPGFVRRDHRRVADLLAQRRVGRRGVAGRTTQHVRQAARRDGQPEPSPQQMGDLRQRDAEVRVQFHDQRDDPGTKLHAGRPQRVGGLQRVAALDTPPAPRAVADLDVEAAHERTHRGEVFLILRRHPIPGDRAAAVRARRCPRTVGLVDSRRSLPTPVPPVVRARPSAGTSAAALPPVFGEGGGLAKPRATRGRQRFLEATDLPPQPVPLAPQAILLPLEVVLLALQLVGLTPQTFVLASQAVVLRRPRGFLVPAGITGATLVRHTQVMPYCEKK